MNTALKRQRRRSRSTTFKDLQFPLRVKLVGEPGFSRGWLVPHDRQDEATVIELMSGERVSDWPGAAKHGYRIIDYYTTNLEDER